jgi:hypothetical protein
MKHVSVDGLDVPWLGPGAVTWRIPATARLHRGWR